MQRFAVQTASLDCPGGPASAIWRQGIDMRTIDALAASAALLAALAFSQMAGQQASPDEIAADTWILEQDMVRLLGAMSSSAEACYAMTLPSTQADEGLLPLARDRAGVALATSCDPTMISQLT
ncbi:hypothetical protein ASE17_09510 [Phenylobacterium sp. Root77]|jgi:hypothetical protein|nr:hypothetical protein ASC73_02080 [Phenylobacterium sp. Root1277]KQW92395.1 hypothetical protein ASC79_12790 [Phenylobacterium sp. Root1290]KRC40625.1 hypothetical protein ASE17_09510 [Phenylobacterium sp. Root77]